VSSWVQRRSSRAARKLSARSSHAISRAAVEAALGDAPGLREDQVAAVMAPTRSHAGGPHRPVGSRPPTA
jgi:hypothetical protein